jgi:hypothetical protein
MLLVNPHIPFLTDRFHGTSYVDVDLSIYVNPLKMGLAPWMDFTLFPPLRPFATGSLLHHGNSSLSFPLPSATGSLLHHGKSSLSFPPPSATGSVSQVAACQASHWLWPGLAEANPRVWATGWLQGADESAVRGKGTHDSANALHISAHERGSCQP